MEKAREAKAKKQKEIEVNLRDIEKF